MIQPREIELKAHRLYAAYIRAVLAGADGLFPKFIPCEKRPGSHLPTAIQEVRKLREASKETIGYGYKVEWREINSRTHGRNYFPIRILFESEDDLLKYTKKEREFRILIGAASRVKQEFPELGTWVEANPKALLKIAAEIDGLIEVAKYLRENPRPHRFAREFPLQIDTKFIGRHQSLLRTWLDVILPPDAIRADEDHFERRYGLNYVEPPILVRALDAAVQKAVSLPCQTAWLPLHSLSILDRSNIHVIVVENLVNLMTLPQIPDAVAIGGLGNSVLLLRYAPWLSNVRVTYWGDVDTEGFEILSRFRAHFPHVRSVMMDVETIGRFRHLAGIGNERPGVVVPPHLTENEERAFRICVESNFRLEQERIPHADCTELFTERFSNAFPSP